MNKSDCIFCRILCKEIPAEILLETDFAVAIKDRQPVAAHHVLIIAKRHFTSLSDAVDHEMLAATFEGNQSEGTLLGMLTLANLYAGRLPGGSRLVINSGADAGQTVEHLHMHVLGGEKLKDL
jgi:histidine triad (HIT) family protein